MTKKLLFAFCALVMCFLAFTGGYFVGHRWKSAGYSVAVEYEFPAIETYAEIPEVSESSAEPVSSEPTTELINLNTADVHDFETLPGVGEEIAKRIVEYRAKIGEFKYPAQLLDVSGIGEKKYDAIKDLVCV